MNEVHARRNTLGSIELLSPNSLASAQFRTVLNDSVHYYERLFEMRIAYAVLKYAGSR